MVNLQWILGILCRIQVLLEEEGLIYKDKVSNVENFLQSMDALCLFPPLSFATTTPSWSQWWCVDMDSGMRSWGLSLFWQVCSGITMDFLTLPVTSRWNDSTADKQNGPLYTCVPVVFYSSHFSLSPQEIPPWASRCAGISHLQKSSIFPTYLELCLYCSKAGEMGSEGREIR